jgi:glutamine---fructose-6-phosphate transaminase (isomerizing)
MCGIVGYVGHKNALPLLIEGLKRLEYRGYDSSGVSYIEDDKIKVIKRKGRLSVLEECLKETNIISNIGIGHTRWATHGEPNDINSHPHLSRSSKLSVVHNGIIENYMQIKEFLGNQGYVFLSDTDTEVISHLIDYHYDGDFLGAVQKTISELQGSYALGVMCADCKDSLIVARKDSPLIIAIGNNENFIASDIPAVIKYTREIKIIEDNEIAVIYSDKVEIYDSLGDKILRESMFVDWDIEEAEKSGFEHFMMKEIHDEPNSVKMCISPRISGDKIRIEGLEGEDGYLANLKKVWIIACGTAYHSGVVGKYIFERFARVNVEVDLASEFRYRDPNIYKDDLVIIISQSGETIDTLFALREAKKKGAKIFSIVNVVGSSIARESDRIFYTFAGPEIAVASTKAYNNQLVSLYMICMYISRIRGTIAEEDYLKIVSEMGRIPECIKETLERKEEIQRFAAGNFNAKSVFFIGRGIDYALSMEGSLKLKEISYIHSEAYAGGELKHGTIALIEEGTLVICSLTQDELYDKMVSNIKEVKARGAIVLVVTSKKDRHLCEVADEVIRIPVLHPVLQPVVAITAMQLFAYYMAVLKGNDVDKPRNLAKSVTVE